MDTTSDAEALEAAARARRSLRDVEPLLDVDHSEHAQVRLHHGVPLTVYRFGAQMLLQASLPGLGGSVTPVCHIRRMVDAGPFDRYLAYTRHVWAQACPVPRHRRQPTSTSPEHVIPVATNPRAGADSSLARARATMRRIVLQLDDETRETTCEERAASCSNLRSISSRHARRPSGSAT